MKNSAALVLYVLYKPLGPHKLHPQKHIPYDLPKKKWLLEKIKFDIVIKNSIHKPYIFGNMIQFPTFNLFYSKQDILCKYLKKSN